MQLRATLAKQPQLNVASLAQQTKLNIVVPGLEAADGMWQNHNESNNWESNHSGVLSGADIQNTRSAYSMMLAGK